MNTPCKHCGEILPPRHVGRGRQRMFCNDNCRVKFGYRELHPRKVTNAERRANRELGGIIPPERMRYGSKKWLAAFWDGEGYIGINRRQRRHGERYYYFPLVQVFNTSNALIHYAAGLLGQLPNVIQERGNGDGNKRLFTLKIARTAMRPFLLKLKPFLIAKQRQAEIVIEFCKISDRCYVREYPEARYEAMFQEMKALNRKGA